MRRSFAVLVALLLCTNAFAAANRWSVSGPEGGWILSLVVDPRDDVVYAGLRSGAVLKSWDRGENWYPVGPGLPETDSVTLAIDPYGTLYAVKRSEVYASVDRGVTWERRGRAYLEELVASPSGALWGSSWSGGIVRSTDGGRTWTHPNQGLPSSGFTAIAVAASGAVFVAAVMDNAVFRSTDEGSHWTRLAGGLPASGPYAVGVDPRDSSVWVGFWSGAWRSSDLGQTFTKVAGIPPEQITHFGFDTTGGRIYACGQSFCFIGTSPGGPWSKVETGEVNEALAVSARTGGLVYLGTDRCGVVRSSDAGLTWKEVNRTLVASEVLGIAVDPSDAARAWAATKYGVFRTTDRGASWQLVRKGEARAVVANPKQPGVITAAIGRGEFSRSTDGGTTWAPLPGSVPNWIRNLALDPQNPEILYAVVPHDLYRYSGGAWTKVAPLGNTVYELAVDPRNAATLYAAGWQGLVRSTDSGTTFTPIMNGIPNGPVVGLAIDPTNSSVLYAVTETSGLYRSTTTGASWTRVDAEGTFPDELSDVAVDPTDPNVLYVSGARTYRSLDRGATFAPFGARVPPGSGLRMAIAGDGHQLYAAGFHGVAALRLSPVVLSAAASLHGAGSFFHSDVSIVNASDQRLTVKATYRCFQGNCGTGTKTFTMEPREMRFYADAVNTLFAAPESGGAIEFDATDHIVVSSRLYSPSRPAPTFGQFVPGLTLDDAFPSSATASVSFSADNTRGFGANAGVFNPLGQQRNLTVKVFDRGGAMLKQKSVGLAPHQAMKLDGLFPWAGVTADVPDAYSTFTVDDNGPLFAYTSVMDNQSRDPFFVRGCEMGASPGGKTILPAVASLHGRNGSFFHSDVAVLNTGAGTTTVTAKYNCMTASCGSPTQTFPVAAGEAVIFNDIVVSLFGAPETGGAVEFDTSGSIAVTSRLYTPSRPGATVGQFIHGMTAANAHAYSILAPLSHSVDAAHGFRVNAGAYNASDVPQSVTFELFRADGTSLAKVVRAVRPRQSVQVNDLFAAAGVTGDVPAAYCKVHGDAGTPLFTFASVLDNQSQDPIFIYGEWWNPSW